MAARRSAPLRRSCRPSPGARGCSSRQSWASKARSSSTSRRDLSSADHHRRIELVGRGHSRGQPAAGDGLDGQRRLALAGLDQQATRPAPATAAPRRSPGAGRRARRRRRRGRRGARAARASGGISAIASVGTYGALATRTSTRPRSVGGQRVVQVALVHTAAAARGCGGRSAPPPGRCRRRAARRPRTRAATARAERARCRSTGRRRRAPRRQAERRPPGSTSNSVRRRGTKTPGSTAIRRPQNSAQPRTCSSGSPATRRATMRGQLGRRRAAATSSARLVLGEDAARGAQPGDDDGLIVRRRGDGHERLSERHGALAARKTDNSGGSTLQVPPTRNYPERAASRASRRMGLPPVPHRAWRGTPRGARPLGPR